MTGIAYFDPDAWYFGVGGAILSTARGEIIAPDDAELTAWLALGNTVRTVPSLGDLHTYLQTRAPRAASRLGAVMQASDAATREAFLLGYAADKRWEIEVGGITLGGIPIATDDRSKIMIMGARVAAAADPDWVTVWHGTDGQTYPLNAASMIAISNAVEAHVNATFATFASVKADIEAGVITTLAAIDAVFPAI